MIMAMILCEVLRVDTVGFYLFVFVFLVELSLVGSCVKSELK